MDVRDPPANPKHPLGPADRCGECCPRAAGPLRKRGYSDLLIEAGGIGQRIYLAAEAAGLAARNLAAFRDDDLNGLLDLDGRERAVLHLTLAGREA